MTGFELQIIGLILVAFVLGVAIGYLLRTRVFPPISTPGDGRGITLESRQERPAHSLLRGGRAAKPRAGDTGGAKANAAAGTAKAAASAREKRAAHAKAKERAATANEQQAAPGDETLATPATEGQAGAASEAKSEPSEAPANAKPDNLQEIKGIGAVLEKKLNAIGIERFEQIASWSESDIAKIDETLNFRGRIQRERWVEQARELAQRSHPDK